MVTGSCDGVLCGEHAKHHHRYFQSQQFPKNQYSRNHARINGQITCLLYHEEEKTAGPSGRLHMLFFLKSTSLNPEEAGGVVPGPTFQGSTLLSVKTPVVNGKVELRDAQPHSGYHSQGLAVTRFRPRCRDPMQSPGYRRFAARELASRSTPY